MVKASGQVAVDLPWLSPCAASLVALARAPAAAAWLKVRTDPGCVLLLVRHALQPCLTLELKPFPNLLRDGEVLQAVCRYLQQQIGISPPSLQGFVDWNQPAVKPVHDSCLTYARLAHGLAEKSRRCEPELAWIAGMLAPLGWLALSAVAPVQVGVCREECRAARDPLAVQQHYFGLDVTALARRLNQRWCLPTWLAAITGHLTLPAETVRPLGGDADLFEVAQLAVGLAEQRGRGLGMLCGTSPEELISRLGLEAAQVKTWGDEILAAESFEEAVRNWESPASQPLLLDLLQVAGEYRRVRDEPQSERLQRDIDCLEGALREGRRTQGERLHQQKMTALAEFAAGAAHEINNPMAVISGQAQYLLGRETDPERRQPLQKIIGQTQRVHQILTEVMLFARPPAPQKQMLDAGAVLREVVNSYQTLADERRVRLVCPELPTPITLNADPVQIGKALGCLLRNAIEAAPEEGWAGVRVELPQPDVLHLIVEDNGKGLTAAERDLLFDPFYSGRKAGRGHGMGLPIAWRLARLHEGDIFLAESGPGPTRFVLSLPLSPLPTPTCIRNGVHDHPRPAAVNY